MDNGKPSRLIAGFWIRALAVVLDVIVMGVIYYAVLWVFWGIAQNLAPVARGLMIGLIWVTWSLLYGALGKGRTPGGALLGLRVCSPSGETPAFAWAMCRAALFTLWAFPRVLTESFAMIWAAGGHPFVAQGIAAYFYFLCAGFALLMPWDAERRSPLDLFSNTRALYKSQSLTAADAPRSRMPASTLRLLYILLFIVIYAVMDRWPSKTQKPLPGTPRQMLQILKWSHGQTLLIAPRVKAIRMKRRGLPNGEEVPTLLLTAWVPRHLLDAAKIRDKEIFQLETQLKKAPELTQGFLQLNLTLITDDQPVPLFGQHKIPFYTDLGANAAAARYYLDHPEVALSTWTVISRYTKESRLPKDWWQSLYNHRDYKGVEATMRKELSQGESLGEVMAAGFIDQLTIAPNAKYFGLCKTVLDDWVQHHPRAALPLILRGKLHQYYAWVLRGGDLAIYADKRQWQTFFDQMNQADTDYRAASRLDPKSSFPWAYRIEVVRALQQESPSAKHLLAEALKRAPWSVEARQIYIFGLTPQWGGSMEEMRDYAAECEKTAVRYPLVGQVELQPIITLAVISKDPGSIYGSAENWPVIQRVFERIFKRYPKEIYYHSKYAWYAYNAKKYDIAADQFALIGDHFYADTGWLDAGNYNTSRAYTYSQKGWIYLQRNDLDTGMPWLLQAMELDPFDTWPMAKLATCYQRKADVANAEKWATRTLQNNPPELDRQEAAGVLTWTKTQKQ